MGGDVCGDNRFEIIARAKQAILDGTNIDTSPDEMKVLDNFLFRCWQMDWLEKYDNDKPKESAWIPCSERLPEERRWCLATFKEPDTGFIGLPKIAVYLMGEHTDYTTEEGWLIANCTDIEMASAERYYKKLQCVAWMPLPTPYKESED